MKVVATLSLILFVAYGSGLTTNTGENCDTSLTAYTVSSFDVTPWPPHKNTNLVMVMTGTMNSAQTLKSMEIFVIYKGSNFYHESIPETGTYAAGQTAVINFKVYLPFIAPSGSYNVQVKLQNTAGTFLNCWQVDFTL